MSDLNLNIIDHISYLSEMRDKDKSDKLKKLSKDTDMIFYEIKSRRIAFKRVKKMSKIWSC
jgi:hypothetical protein